MLENEFGDQVLLRALLTMRHKWLGVGKQSLKQLLVVNSLLVLQNFPHLFKYVKRMLPLFRAVVNFWLLC